MATLTIMDYEAREDLLPSVCLKCGSPATTRVEKSFSWYPRWIFFLVIFGVIGIIIFAVLVSNMVRRMKLRIPLCENHKNIWSKVNWMTYGSLLGLLAAAFLLTIFGSAIDNIRGWRGSSLGIILGGWVAALVSWLIVVAVVCRMSISPSSITDDRISLTGVSEQFIEALDSERDEAERVDRLERDQRRRTYDDLADERLPPRPSKPDDRIRG